MSERDVEFLRLMAVLQFVIQCGIFMAVLTLG